MSRNILMKKKMDGNCKYHYCPHCYKELKDTGYKPEESLAPVFYLKELIRVKSPIGFKNVIQEFYQCTRCNRELTVDDFVDAYCKPYKQVEGVINGESNQITSGAGNVRTVKEGVAAIVPGHY